MAILQRSGAEDTSFGFSADVRVERTDANTISLVGVSGSSKKIWVSGNFVLDLSSSKSIDTDSASDYLVSESGGSVSIGSTAFSALTTGFNDYTILYLYLTDNSDCWNFSSPTSKDYRESIIISDNAPDEAGGHMASSGEGYHARHLGWVILNSSRQMDSDLSLASAFNDIPASETVSSTSSGWVVMTLATENSIAGVERYVMIPTGWRISVFGSINFKNDDANAQGFRGKIKFDATEKEAAHIGGVTSSVIYVDTLEMTYRETVTTDSNPKISLAVDSEGASGSPDYNADFSYLSLARTPPSQTPGYTRRQPAGTVTPDYTPPDFMWSDAATLLIPKGRYYMAGHRIGGQYQNHEDMGTYYDLSANYSLDVDGSALVGGDVVSSWYSVFMKDDGAMLVLPYIRVDAIAYSAPDTTINPADHDDGTTANDNFVSADDCFNDYRLVYISLDSNRGSTWTISDSVNGTPDQVKVSEDMTSVVSAGDWLQMIPKATDSYLYLGSIRFDSSGNLRQFLKNRWRYAWQTYVTISGNLATSYANTEIGSALPPVAARAKTIVYIDSDTQSVSSCDIRLVWGTGGSASNPIGHSYRNDGTSDTLRRIYATLEFELTAVTSVRNVFRHWQGSAWIASPSGTFGFIGWEE